MPEPLWNIRQRKGMTVSQLASRSGVPAISITEYESGHAIRSADLPRLAKALYVEEWDIEIKGKPRPAAGRTPSAAASASQPKAAEPSAAKAPPSSPLARPSQIEHLLSLAQRQFGDDRVALEQELGKPLEELTRSEASHLLTQYQRKLAESRATRLDSSKSKRKRAYLPEGVDEFELAYLTSQQESRALLHFTLFDGQRVSGSVIGFGPYSITIRENETGEEITLQKLAIAYYRVASRKSNGDES